MDEKSAKYITISVAAFVCYCNTLWGGFLFDDTEAIVKNKDVQPDTTIAQIFENDFWGSKIALNSSHKSYRPLTILSYRLNVVYSKNKLDAFQFHVTNIVLYDILCLLTVPVFELFIRKEKHEHLIDDVAFTASLLFTVHPVHTESVAALVGRADILAAILCLVLLLVYRSLHKTLFILWFSTIFLGTACAVLCKETAITVLGLCIVLDVYQSKSPKRSWSECLSQPKFLLRMGSLLVIGFTIMVCRLAVMNFEGPIFSKTDNPAAFSGSYITKLLTFNYIYLLNAVLLIWPQWLCFDWSMGCVPLVDGRLEDYRIALVVIFWCLGTYFVFNLVRKCVINQFVDLHLMSFLLAVLPFIPAANILFPVGFVVAERTLLLPSFGYCFLIALGLKRLKERFCCLSEVLTILFLLLCLTFAGRSVQRNFDWLSEEKLFRSALEVCPNNAKVHYNIAKVAADTGRQTEAINRYKHALDLYPNYEQAMNNLANILRENGKYEQAEKLLRKAVEVRPNFAAAWMNLAIVLTNLNQTTEAENCYKNAIFHRVRYPDCYYNLGNLYLDQRRHEEALLAWRNATELRPTIAAAWGNRLALLDSLGRLQEALKVGSEALKFNPAAPSLYFAVGNVLGKLKKFQNAEKHFLKAIFLNPANAMYYSNLGVLYHRWDKVDHARKMYQKALTIDPKLKSAHDNLKKLESNILNETQ